MNGRVSKKQAVFKIRAEHICITVTYLTYVMYVTKFVLHLTHDAYKMRFITFTNSLVVVTWFMYTEVRSLPTRLHNVSNCDAQVMTMTHRRRAIQLCSYITLLCLCNER